MMRLDQLELERSDKTRQEGEYVLAEARAYVRKKAAYFCSTIYNFRNIWVTGVGTLGVSSRLVCAIDAEWYLGLPSLKMRSSCLVHECHHILRGMDRLMSLPDPEIANIAADLAINCNMLDEKLDGEKTWELPSFALTPDKFGFPNGKTMEWYYDELMKLPRKVILVGGGDGDGSGAGGKAQQGGGGGEGGKGDGTSNAPGAPYQLGNQRIENKIFSGGCGGIAGGSGALGDIEAEADEKYGHTPSEVERIRKAGIQEIKEAQQGRGSVPASLKFAVEWEEQEAVVPWPDLISNTIETVAGRIISGQADYSLRRPSRRSYTTGVLRPGLIDHEITILFIRDTSGSMGVSQLTTATIETVGAMRTLNVQRAWFLDADAASHKPEMLTIDEIAERPIVGGGGTNFTPALLTGYKLDPRPDLIIYHTDGDGYAPANPPPGIETIWCVVPSPWQRIPAPWGTLVVMSDDLRVREAHEYVPPTGGANYVDYDADTGPEEEEEDDDN